MKRDMDLIRDILLEIEKSDTTSVNSSNFDEIKKSHIMLLHDKNYVKANYSTFADGQKIIFKLEMTMEGYDLLDTIRYDNIYQATKAKLAEKGLKDVSIEIFESMAKGFAKKHLGISE